MASSIKQPKSPLLVTRTMVWVVIIAYSLFLVGKSTYQNYRMNREIDVYKEKITQLERVKHNLQLTLLYYGSKSYKEVEARRRLNLKGRDEFVIALPQAKSEPVLTTIPA